MGTPRLVATLFLTATMSPIATLRSMGNAAPIRTAAPSVSNRGTMSAAPNSSDNTQRNCLRWKPCTAPQDFPACTSA